MCQFPLVQPEPRCMGCYGAAPEDGGSGSSNGGTSSGGASAGGGTTSKCGSGAACPDGQLCNDGPSDIKPCCPWVQRCYPRCENSDACADGEWCEAYHCNPLFCNEGYTCPADTVCDVGKPEMDDHGCAPLPCDAPGSTYQCPAGTHCDARTGTDGRHCRVWCSEAGCGQNQACGDDEGCVPRPCKQDSDCDCGVCGDGTCQSAMGQCFFGTGGTGG